MEILESRFFNKIIKHGNIVIKKSNEKEYMQFAEHVTYTPILTNIEQLSRTGHINIIELFSQAENLNHDVVIIDYINLMAPINPKDKLWENIGEAFRLAKRWAEKTQKVVIMLVQIDEDTGAIKYAKSIKHHSDGVWVWKWGETEKETGQVEIEQIKLRNFKPTKFPLQAEFEFCTFTEMSAGVATPVGTTPKPMDLNA